MFGCLQVLIHMSPFRLVDWDLETAERTEGWDQGLGGSQPPPYPLTFHEIVVSAPKVVACDDEDVLAEHITFLRNDFGRKPGVDLREPQSGLSVVLSVRLPVGVPGPDHSVGDHGFQEFV